MEIDIIIKWAIELYSEEIEEMNAIVLSYDSGLPKDHLLKTHIEKHNPLFIIAKKGKRIISFQCHSIYYEQTPFSKYPLPIILGGAAYHLKDQPKKGLANKMAKLFLQQCFGRFWFLKRIVMIADTVNPKSLRAMNMVFKGAFPDMHKPSPKSIQIFTRNIMKKYYGQQVELDEYFVMRNAHQYNGITNITHSWETMYRTKNEAYERYYLDQEVIKKIGNNYFINGDSIVGVCYYSPVKLLSSYFKKLFKQKLATKDKRYWWQSERNTSQKVA